MGMSDVLDDWLGFNPPQAPTPPPVQAPPQMPKYGESPMLRFMRGRGRGGRAGTILTGDLMPMDIGKRRLLGGA
jgi:hypothetical protein